MAAGAAALVAVGVAGVLAATFTGSADGIVLTGQGYVCEGPIDVELLKIYNPGGNALTIADGCSGTIGRVEIDTWTDDGIRVIGAANGPVTIGGGYIRCHARAGSVHQDGIQIFGNNVTFTNLDVDCGTANNGGLFLSANSTNAASGIVFRDGTLRPANSTLFAGDSSNGGNEVTGSVICEGRSFTVRGQANLDVFSGNTILPASDSRCALTATVDNMEPRPPADTPPPTTTDPPPPPDPDPVVCDQACVDSYQAQIAALTADVAALEVSVAARDALIASIVALLETWASQAPG